MHSAHQAALCSSLGKGTVVSELQEVRGVPYSLVAVCMSARMEKTERLEHVYMAGMFATHSTS